MSGECSVRHLRVGAGLAVVVLDDSGGGSCVDATLASLDALVLAGVEMSVVVARSSAGSALNAAVAAAPGELVAFVPAGGLTGSAWLADLEAAVSRHPQAGAVAGVTVDGRSGATRRRARGVGFAGHLLPSAPPPSEPSPTMVLGDNWVVRREVLTQVGGFDRFSSFPEGAVDLAWRLWLLAGGVVLDPALVLRDLAETPDDLDTSIEPVPTGVRGARTAAIEREVAALAAVRRNLDSRNLAAAWEPVRALAGARLAALGWGADAHREALDRFEAMAAHVESERRRVQHARLRPDAEIVAVMGDPLGIDLDLDLDLDLELGADAYAAAHAAAVEELGDDHAFGGRFRIAVVTADTLSARMAGPGIRARRIARELAPHHRVRLASMTAADLREPDMEVSVVDPKGVAELVEWCDVLVFQGWVMAGNPAFRRTDRVFLVDVYDPMHLEQLEQARDDGGDGRLDAVRRATAVLSDQLLRGDLFLCASPRQRDLWIGHLAALGRVNPATYDSDPTLGSLVAVVPFGISDEPPRRTRPALKGVVPGIGVNDKVVLWGGGVYNWFDPLTLVRAVDRLRRRREDVRLVFLGMRHPNPTIPEMRMAAETRRLASELGLVGTHVFFNEEWVAYDDRQNYLLDADVAVTTHLHHVETEFSFRTRVLDYFWAGLPTVATRGDSLADLIESRELGITVPPGDVDALESALSALLEDDELAARCRENIDAVVPELRWSQVLRPVVEACAAPRRAPDLVAGIVHPGPYFRTEEVLVAGGLRRDLGLVVGYLREGGPAMLAAKAGDRVRRGLGGL